LRAIWRKDVCSFLAENGESTIVIDAALHDPRQPTTTAEWAALDFQPIPAQELRQPPSYADWMRMSHKHLVTLSVTWKILGMTKEELKKFVRENGDDTALNELLQSLTSTRDTFECFSHASRTAKARLVCAGAAVELESRPKDAWSEPQASVRAA
jgi:hypothetical protein